MQDKRNTQSMKWTTQGRSQRLGKVFLAPNIVDTRLIWIDGFKVKTTSENVPV